VGTFRGARAASFVIVSRSSERKESKAALPATACATPARLKMLLRPMLCTQHPSRAAITVTDIAARPADKKNSEAFQHPGKTLESVAKPSTLKFAQCVLPNSCVQRLKIPTLGVYSSVPFPENPTDRREESGKRRDRNPRDSARVR